PDTIFSARSAMDEETSKGFSNTTFSRSSCSLEHDKRNVRTNKHVQLQLSLITTLFHCNLSIFRRDKRRKQPELIFSLSYCNHGDISKNLLLSMHNRHLLDHIILSSDDQSS